jgi:ABC-type transport system substrate-binding protein
MITRLLALALPVVFVLGFAVSSYPALLKVGMMDEPKTLNPFAARDIWSAKVLSLCYQRLYYRDPKSDALVPWLAADDPVWDAEKKTVTFHLKKAQWDNGAPFTADDVVFTSHVFRKFRLPKYWNSWSFVKKAEALDPQTVQLTLTKPMAILWDRTLTSFVVQKSKWAELVARAEKALTEGLEAQKKAGKKGLTALRAALAKPLEILTTYPNEKPESLGAFSFQQWQRGSFIHMQANDRFFARNGEIGGHKVGPHVSGVLLKIYRNTDTAILALKKGDIDYLWWGIESGYLEDLKKDPNVHIFSVLKSGYRYMAFNLRRPLLGDPAVRRAIAFLVDKDFIVKRVLHKQGERLDTLVPQDNKTYFNPNTTKYGMGLSWKDRVEKSKNIMKEAGYTWKAEPVGGDMTGYFVSKGEGLTMPDGKPAPDMTLLTPPADYDAQRAQAGNLIQQWMRDFGIPVSWRPMSFGAMIKKVRSERDFDFFVSGWGALGRDPDYLRSFFHSRADRPTGRNSGGYRSEEYDRLVELQAATMDMEKRREIVFQLQEILMRDLPYVPLYVPLNLEGVRIDRFKDWVQMGGGIGNLWSFLMVKPAKP